MAQVHGARTRPFAKGKSGSVKGSHAQEFTPSMADRKSAATQQPEPKSLCLKRSLLWRSFFLMLACEDNLDYSVVNEIP